MVSKRDLRFRLVVQIATGLTVLIQAPEAPRGISSAPLLLDQIKAYAKRPDCIRELGIEIKSLIVPRC